VRVAILNSGLELSEEDKGLYNYSPKLQYQSWVENDPQSEWRDDSGYGTHLTTLLRENAPHAAIYMARVFDHRENLDKFQDQIAAAIRHAVDVWKVDIIVMPWGFSNTQHNPIYPAIKHAASQDVIMLAAASDTDIWPGIQWPASDPHVICVHSGSRNGKSSDFTPCAEENRGIIVLGESIQSAWPPALGEPGNRKTLSSTSCAVMLAAAIFAALLDYAR
ncbi:subtilisin-like protein, partial [Aspergillus sclerotiicarbonarius CBS 121057]